MSNDAVSVLRVAMSVSAIVARTFPVPERPVRAFARLTSMLSSAAKSTFALREIVPASTADTKLVSADADPVTSLTAVASTVPKVPSMYNSSAASMSASTFSSALVAASNMMEVGSAVSVVSIWVKMALPPWTREACVTSSTPGKSTTAAVRFSRSMTSSLNAPTAVVLIAISPAPGTSANSPSASTLTSLRLPSATKAPTTEVTPEASTPKLVTVTRSASFCASRSAPETAIVSTFSKPGALDIRSSSASTPSNDVDTSIVAVITPDVAALITLNSATVIAPSVVVTVTPAPKVAAAQADTTSAAEPLRVPTAVASITPAVRASIALTSDAAAVAPVIVTGTETGSPKLAPACRAASTSDAEPVTDVAAVASTVSPVAPTILRRSAAGNATAPTVIVSWSLEFVS